MSTTVLFRDYLDAYPNIELAQRDDNQEINDFLATVPMEAESIALKYDRTPDFFKFLTEQAPYAYVIKMLNKDRSIGGIGVISVRDAWVNQTKAQVAYTSDLRVGPSLWSRTRVQWRKAYEGIVRDAKTIRELSGVSFFYTAVFDDNEQAKKALVHTKSDFTYTPLCGYQSINIYAKRLTLNARRLSPGQQLKTNLSPDEVAKLRQFLHHTNKSIEAGQYYDDPFQQRPDDEYHRRKREIDGYDFSQYLVITNEQGAIISCCYPWANENSRKIIIEKMSFPYKLRSCILPLIGGKTLRQGERLNMLYLMDLLFDPTLSDSEQANVVSVYLQHLHSRRIHKKYHLINLIDYYNPHLHDTLKQSGYFFEPKAATLYQVLHQEHFQSPEHYKVLPQDRQQERVKVSFELALS